jgi:ADP-ribose pyrophosphatase YjhB (NUDIX family)
MNPSPIDSTWYQRPPGIRPRTSAGGVIVRHDPAGLLLAFAREADFPLYVLPKGGVKRGETLEQAARREIAEEAGLTELTLLRYLGVCPRLNFAKDRWMTIHYFLFTTRQVEGQPTDSAHHFGVWWFPLTDLPPMLWPEQRQLIEAHRQEIQAILGHELV